VGNRRAGRVDLWQRKCDVAQVAGGQVVRQLSAKPLGVSRCGPPLAFAIVFRISPRRSPHHPLPACSPLFQLIPPMKYFVTDHNDEVQGPYSVEEITNLLASGDIDATALSCEEGSETWQPLSTILPAVAPTAPTPTPDVPQESVPPAPATPDAPQESVPPAPATPDAPPASVPPAPAAPASRPPLAPGAPPSSRVMGKPRTTIRCERCKTVFRPADGVCPTCHWKPSKSRVKAALLIGIILGLLLLFLAAYLVGRLL
jgi:hypothetical protein